MARPRRIDPQLVQRAREIARQTQDIRELRQALSVLLPAELKASLEQTARVLGVGRATVPRLQAGFRERPQSRQAARKAWGGRRRALMSAQEELEFLKPWAEQAEAGGGAVGGLSLSGATWLAESGAGYPSSQERSPNTRGLE